MAEVQAAADDPAASEAVRQSKAERAAGSLPLSKIPTFTKASISKMNRSGLETLATAIFANRATSQGLSIQEGIHRAKSLMSGNTTAQLRKYFLKYGKK